MGGWNTHTKKNMRTNATTKIDAIANKPKQTDSDVSLGWSTIPICNSTTNWFREIILIDHITTRIGCWCNERISFCVMANACAHNWIFQIVNRNRNERTLFSTVSNYLNRKIDRVFAQAKWRHRNANRVIHSHSICLVWFGLVLCRRLCNFETNREIKCNPYFFEFNVISFV